MFYSYVITKNFIVMIHFVQNVYIFQKYYQVICKFLQKNAEKIIFLAFFGRFFGIQLIYSGTVLLKPWVGAMLGKPMAF